MKELDESAGNLENRDPRKMDCRWRARHGGEYHAVRTGAVAKSALIELPHWRPAFWLVCSSKKGITDVQIRREWRLSSKTVVLQVLRTCRLAVERA